ncbi:MAG TPA: TonB-dependent receptor, partial [Blastocatellia bacterium]|nr:TonB-dependent receptor [Blastocatellia bacterium]
MSPAGNSFANISGTIKALFICLLLLGVPSASRAQTTSTIVGTVRDGTGAVLDGVKISARYVDTGHTRATISEADGRFVFPELPVGAYEIRAEREGFRPLLRQGIRVTIGETAVLDLVMEVGALDQEVTISGGPPLVNTQSPELSYLVSQKAIEELPLNGRNYTDLALLQPGVIAYPHRDGGSVVAHGLGASINGQDPRSNVYLLDGTIQNDFTNGPAGSAAGTALGIETIREFRVETNTYGAEFGRNSGGQIVVVTKPGTNELHGSLYHFHRNDNFDARNFFDPSRKPEFKRNQFGISLGGPIKRDRSFIFGGYEALRERLGRTISTVVPDFAARQGILPDPNNPGRTITVQVNPLVRPYLDEFPLPNGPSLGGGLAAFNFGFGQQIDQDFAQVRFDQNVGADDQFFARYTFDDAKQFLPTDFPQFPRSFVSRNQFFTGEYRNIVSSRTLNIFRLGFSRTRIGQEVESSASSALQPFIPGRDLVGNIDIGGIPRFGPQTSVNVSLRQNVFSFEHGLTHTRGRHLLKMGGLAEHYQDNMYNPTFGLGIWTFTSLSDFLRNRPQRFLGLSPEGELDRYWRFTLFGFYLQDSIKVSPRLNVNAGLRYEFSTMPVDIYGRDSALIRLSDPEPLVGELYKNPTYKNISPRVGFAYDVFGDGRTSLRGGYGLYFNTNNQQTLIVTVTNPPATPRIIIANPTFAPIFPNAPFERGVGNSIRPVQWDLENPYLHVFNMSLQRELWFDTVVTIGYAGSRGIHLLRSNDVNTPQPVVLPGGTSCSPNGPVLPAGTLCFPAGAPRPNTKFSTIELKSSDGNSWYNAMILEVRKRWSSGFNFQSSYTFSRNIDTTQASTFFSDATNGTTTAFPEFPGFDYNKGLSDYHAKHNWVVNFSWEVPFAKNVEGAWGKLLDGWQLAGIAQMRSGNPLTVFVQRNRSRSLWSPSLGPGIGFDRPSLAPGRTYEDAVLGGPDQYFDPSAFELQPEGTLGNIGRGALIGPNLRTFDLSAKKKTRWARLGENTDIEFRIEAFNLFNRANFGNPGLLAFAGAPDQIVNGQRVPEKPLSSFGRIRSTVTSSRQIQ